MHKDERERIILKIAGAAIAAFLVFCVSFAITFIDRGIYDRNFGKNGAYEKIGPGVRDTTDSLISYLSKDADEADSAPGLYIFTKAERDHLEDVHAIFKRFKYAAIISSAALLIIIMRMRANGVLSQGWQPMLKLAGIIAASALALLFVLSLNFDWFFTNFHYIFFPQGNWQFPADSLLITMFPADFFRSFVLKMFFHALVGSLILYFIGTSKNFTAQKADDAHARAGKRR